MTRNCIVCATPLQFFLEDMCDVETHERFSILRCVQCSLEQTDPHPHDLAPYYTKNYHGGRHGFTDYYCARRRISWVNQCSDTYEKLLDIGCGEGTFLLAAKRRGWQVQGVELNPVSARQAGLDVFEDLEALSASAPFQCITLWHSLEHLSAPEQILSKIYDYLAPGGLVFIAVPNARGWQSRLFKTKWLHRDVPRHLYHFTPQSLFALLESKNFSIMRQWHQEFEYDLLGWSQSALNYIFKTPNVFFNLLRGRAGNMSGVSKLMQWVSGVIISILAIPLVPLSSWAKAGGTLVVVARKKGSSG